MVLIYLIGKSRMFETHLLEGQWTFPSHLSNTLLEERSVSC